MRQAPKLNTATPCRRATRPGGYGGRGGDPGQSCGCVAGAREGHEVRVSRPEAAARNRLPRRRLAPAPRTAKRNTHKKVSTKKCKNRTGASILIKNTYLRAGAGANGERGPGHFAKK